MYDATKESRFYFEDIIDGKGEMSNPKDIPNGKWSQWEYIIYKYLSQRKNSCIVPLSCVIRKYTPGPDDKKTGILTSPIKQVFW